MTNLTIARRYAKALLGIGKENKQYAQYAEELNAFVGVLDQNPDLMDALSNPLYPLTSRKKILEAVLGKTDFSSVINHFLTLLMEKQRVRYVRDIAASYQKMVDDLTNVAAARIISASELSEEVVGQIKAAVEKMTGKTVKLELEIDPSIIGGIITKVGDMNFDGSVRTQLTSLKETLKRGE